MHESSVDQCIADAIITLQMQYKDSRMNFAKQVRYVREHLGLSQIQLANALNVSFTTINRWENEKVTPSKLAQRVFYDFCESNFIDEHMLKAI